MSDKKDNKPVKEPARKPSSEQANESNRSRIAYDSDGGGITSGSIATNARPPAKDKK